MQYRMSFLKKLFGPRTVLRNAELKYYTGRNHAVWGSGHTKVFGPSDFDPPLPASGLEYLLDGRLYNIPEVITGDACLKIAVNHMSEAATALRRDQDEATRNAEIRSHLMHRAANLILAKLVLSLAVRNCEAWDSAWSTIDDAQRSL